MDLDRAVSAHVEWKMKLRSAISAQVPVDAATIAKDNCCELGKWLHGEARTKHGHLQSYKECLTSHAQFHREAGKIAQLINQKNFAEAEKSLNGASSFGTASSSTSVAISRLKREVAG
jgi:methyl-accepting chemotaxis protein